MAHALDQHADQAYAELTERQKQIAEKLFKALTDKAPMRAACAARPPLRRCARSPTRRRRKSPSVIEVFREPSRSFLMPPAGEPLAGDGDRHFAREPDAGMAAP